MPHLAGKLKKRVLEWLQGSARTALWLKALEHSRLERSFRRVASHWRTPTRTERIMTTVLVDYAVRTVAWQRSQQAVQDAAVKAENLDIALQTSRHIGAAIGILMNRHKITDDQAFEVLRLASMHSHRKLRDLALEVITTGSLELHPKHTGPWRRAGHVV
jgi:hypothetical protein